MEYTREKLIEICERAIVKQSNWMNRDSASAQQVIGQALVFLKAGCDFEVKTKENTDRDSGCITNDSTIWIQFWVKDFQWFEYGNEDGWDRPKQDGKIGNENNDYHFYLPTEKILKEAKGNDWY